MADELTSRRSALTGLAVTIAAGVAGYLVARGSAAARAKGATTAANGYGAAVSGTGQRLAGLGQVPAGGGVILSGPKIVLTRDAGGTLHGFSAVCTHQGCVVDKVADGVISCPCHGSRFDIRTGAVLAGPAPRPLPMVQISVRDGVIYTG
jgi:Rieske Fe-S protein